MLFSSLSDAQKNELWASLALLHTAGLGAGKRKKLVDFFGSAYAAVQQAAAWGEARAGVKTASFEYFKNEAWRTEASSVWKKIQSSQAGILLYTDAAYPQALKEIFDAPLLLFYLGDQELLSNAAVAIVGARKCSAEGTLVAENIARDLSGAGVTCVSGLARGIDRTVHLAGLTGIGSSIAVLGCGVDVLYPADNRDLYEQMRKHGLLLSEFFPGTPPLPHNFPVRNRIISGLARAVLVVEAAQRSGTLITARHALEQNRDVYAVPGSTLAATSEGCRELIRRGAKAVFSARDILLELAPILGAELQEKLMQQKDAPVACADMQINNSASVPEPVNLPWTNNHKDDMEQKPAHKCTDLSADEAAVVAFINGKDSCHVDELTLGLGMQVSKLSAILSMLEIKGVLKRLPGMYYSLRN